MPSGSCGSEINDHQEQTKMHKAFTTLNIYFLFFTSLNLFPQTNFGLLSLVLTFIIILFHCRRHFFLICILKRILKGMEPSTDLDLNAFFYSISSAEIGIGPKDDGRVFACL
jgi:hypothetical protein